jgi:hypothetical protein
MMLYAIVTLNLAVSIATLYCLFRFIHTATDTLCLWAAIHDSKAWGGCKEIFERDLKETRKKRSGN